MRRNEQSANSGCYWKCLHWHLLLCSINRSARLRNVTHNGSKFILLAILSQIWDKEYECVSISKNEFLFWHFASSIPCPTSSSRGEFVSIWGYSKRMCLYLYWCNALLFWMSFYRRGNEIISSHGDTFLYIVTINDKL